MLCEAGRLPLRAAPAVAAAAAPPPPHTPRVAGLDERPQQRRGRRGEEEEKAAAAEEVAVFVVSLLRAPEAAAPAVVVGGGCEGARLPARPPGPRGRGGGGGGGEDDDVRGDCLPRRRLLRARRGRILRSRHLLFLPGAGGAVHVGSRRLGGRRGAGTRAVRRGLSGSLSAAAVRPRLGRPLPEDLHHCAQ